MIGEYELYHGAAIRDLIVGYGRRLIIEPCDDSGRINTFVVNGAVGIHIKHSSKRLPPWQFTFSTDHVSELERLAARCRAVWVLLACGFDGVVAISIEEFLNMNAAVSGVTCFVRVDRDRNEMYRLNGSSADLGRAKPRGLKALFDKLDT